MNPISLIALAGLAYYFIRDKVNDIANKLGFSLRSVKYTGAVSLENKQTGKSVKAARFTANFLITNKNNVSLAIRTFRGMLMYNSDGIALINFSPSIVTSGQTASFPIEILIPYGDALAAVIKLLTGSIFPTDPDNRTGLHMKGRIAGAYGALPFASNFDEPVTYTAQLGLAESNNISLEKILNDLL